MKQDRPFLSRVKNYFTKTGATGRLHVKMWRNFMILTLGIILLLWFLQIVFLYVFYDSMKAKEVEKKGEQLVAAYLESEEVYNSKRFTLMQEDSVIVELYTYENGQYHLNQSNNIINRKPVTLYSGNTFINLIERMDNSPKNSASITQKMDKNINLMVYGKKIDENTYLVLSCYLTLMGTTIPILANQLMWVTAIAFAFALILSYIMSTRLSNPIRQMTQSASRLAKGDYGVRFAEGEYEEMNELAKTLNYATYELNQTEQLRKDFIASVSHDLRTPLTMIKAYGELIRDISGEDKAKRDKNVQVIIDEADRLSDLVTDCLDLSKMQSGTAQLDLETIGLDEVVKFVLNQFDIYAQSEGYIFSLDIKGDDFKIVGDLTKIRRVLYNLIGNAINYTGQDKRVNVCLESTDTEILFSVTDTGAGIAQNDLQQIWERYQRGSIKQKKQVVSTGLGLSIVKEILINHHAKYGVNSIEGQGSTFWFSFEKSQNQKLHEAILPENGHNAKKK